jgi:hypothetical protein
MSVLISGLTNSVIKHYETTPGKDEMQQEQRREVKEKVRVSDRRVSELTILVAEDSGSITSQECRTSSRDRIRDRGS